MNNSLFKILFMILLASPLVQAQTSAVDAFQTQTRLHLQSLSDIHDRITKRAANFKESNSRDLAICLEIGQSNESLHNLLDQAHVYAEAKQESSIE